MLAVGSVMSAATAFRVGATSLTLWSEQAPKLMELWLKAEEDEGDAVTKLRDEVFTTARDAAKRVNVELVGGINDADRFTKPRPKAPQSSLRQVPGFGSGRWPGVSR